MQLMHIDKLLRLTSYIIDPCQS